MSSGAARHNPATVLSWTRAAIAIAVGCAAGSVAALVGAAELVPIVSWVVAVLVVLTWVWRVMWPQDPAGTERLAEGESQRRTTDSGALIAAGLSLVAVALAVVRASRGTDAEAVAAVLLSLLGAILSWCLVNTVFALKYARLYYLEDGGIDFDRSGPPAYSDFAYLAFTVGMTFATSENEPTSSSVRKTALGHALLSYGFGTVIVATAINLVTNLGQ